MQFFHLSESSGPNGTFGKDIGQSSVLYKFALGVRYINTKRQRHERRRWSKVEFRLGLDNWHKAFYWPGIGRR